MGRRDWQRAASEDVATVRALSELFGTPVTYVAGEQASDSLPVLATSSPTRRMISLATSRSERRATVSRCSCPASAVTSCSQVTPTIASPHSYGSSDWV
jgi:hypothetical protein